MSEEVKTTAEKKPKTVKTAKAEAPVAETKAAKKEAKPVEKVEKPAAKKPAKAAKSDKKIKVTLVRSTCGRVKEMQATVEALGLKKIRSSRVHNDNPAIRGMIFKVKHLVTVEDVK